MATEEDVRRIARTLPGTTVEQNGLVCSVNGKSFVWPWLERVPPKKTRAPRRDVIGVRVANELEKQSLLSLDSDVFFTEPHYDGYPAVLVRLAAIDVDLLTDVLAAAWRTRASEVLPKLEDGQ